MTARFFMLVVQVSRKKLEEIMEEERPVRCCVCRARAWMIVYDNGWTKPCCLTCWPQIDIPKDERNHPVSGELVWL